MMSKNKLSFNLRGKSGLVLAFLLLTLTLAACGDNTSAVVPNEVRLATATSSPEEDSIVNQQLANFARVHPEIKVSREIIASDYDTKIKTLIAGNNPPDLFYVDSLIAPDYISGKVLEPLDQYLQKNNVDVKDFYPTLLEAYVGPDKKIYGLPKDHNTLGMFYNKDYFQQAGIETPPRTWDELNAALAKLKKVMPADTAPIAADPDLARVLPWVYQSGGAMLSADLKSSEVTRPGFKKGLDYYLSWRQAGYSRKASELGADWAGDALIKRRAAIAFEGAWLVPALDKSPLKDKVAIAEMPKGDQAATMDFTVAYVMSSKAKNKEASFTLLNFLTSAEQQKLLTDSGLALPSRQSLTAAFVERFPARKPLVDGVQYAHPWQFGVGFGGFADKINPIMQGLFSGNKNPDQAIQEMDGRVKNRL